MRAALQQRQGVRPKQRARPSACVCRQEQGVGSCRVQARVHALATIVILFLLIASLTAAQSVAPYPISATSNCTSTLLFYAKYYYNTSLSTAPQPFECIWRGIEQVPGAGATPACIMYPRTLAPSGSRTVREALSTFPFFYVSASIANGPDLQYGGAGQAYFDLNNQRCSPGALDCLAWTRVNAPGPAQLSCSDLSIVSPPPSPPPPPPSPAAATKTALTLRLDNKCNVSSAVVAVRYNTQNSAVTPREGSLGCRHQGNDTDGLPYCTSYWLVVPPGGSVSLINTTYPRYYLTAYFDEDITTTLPGDQFFNLSSATCPDFTQPGCLQWLKRENFVNPAEAMTAPLACSALQARVPPPSSRPPPSPARAPASPAPALVPVPPAPAPTNSTPNGDGAGNSSGSSGSSSTGIIAGAAAGVGAAIVGIVTGLFMWRRKKRRRAVEDGKANGGSGDKSPLQSIAIDEADPAALLSAKGKELSVQAAALAAEDPLVSFIKSLPPGTPPPPSRSGSDSMTSASLAAETLSSSGSSGVGSMRPRGSMGSGASGQQLDGLPRSALVQFEELELLKRIGEGSYGRVYLAVWRETFVACKILINSASDAAAPTDWKQALDIDERMLGRLKEEARIMLALRHTNVLQIFGISTSPAACIISEYCGRGSLTDVIRAARAAPADLPWRRRLELAMGAARGMFVLHASNPPILHRDLKSPNLLVDANWTVKVSDFNLSKIVEEAQHSQSSQAAMNPRWLAPEVMRGRPAIAASDVFSYGIVLWELLTWELPWAAEGASNAWQIVGTVLRGGRLPIPPRDQLPGADTHEFAGLDAYIALMQRCWAHEPEARPSFAQVARELRELVHALGGDGDGPSPTMSPASSSRDQQSRSS